MHKYLTYSAFGWLTFTGFAHFAIDVASQYLRGKRPPGIETTLYYGLHSSYALGQALFGMLCLSLASRHPGFLADRAVAAVCLFGAAGWLAITFLMEYREPRITAALFLALLVAAIATSGGARA